VLALFTPLSFGLVGQFMPGIACLAYLAKLWWAGELYGVQQAVLVAWLIAAVAIQVESRGPWMWIAGFVGQVALAIVLVLKDQIDETL